MDPQDDSEGISKEVSERLYLELKRWSADLENGADAFRYEMFAKRIVAAEYGRQDAVEWAMEWYRDLLRNEQEAAAAASAAYEMRELCAAQSRSELAAGRCGNPHYQAFLDTVERPDLLPDHHAPFLCWIGPLIGQFERLPKIKDLSVEERDAAWREFLNDARNANLAPRLRAAEAAPPATQSPKAR